MDVPKKLRVYEDYGVVFASQSDAEYVGDCCFCDKADHFYANADTGQFTCHKCRLEGNVISFLEFVIDDRLDATSNQDYEQLSKKRGIPAPILQQHRLAIDDGVWLIPVQAPTGRTHDVRRWSPGDGRIRSTTGCKTQLFGGDRLANKNRRTGRIWIAEGEWDAMALESVFSELNKNDTVVGVPGAGVFKKQWIDLFRNRDVVICYDNDDAGREGSQKVARMLHGAASSVKAVEWPEEKPDAYDTRDFVIARRKKRSPASKIIRRLLSFAEDVAIQEDATPDSRETRDPHALSESLLDAHFHHDGELTLRFQNGRWLHWEEFRYTTIPDEEMRARVNKLLRDRLNLMGSTDPLMQTLINNVIRAMEAACLVSTHVEMSSWIGRSLRPASGDLLAMANGLLDLEGVVAKNKTVLHPHTSAWFSATHWSYEYVAKARCPKWRSFLEEVLPPAAKRNLLQEFAGLCLCFDTSFHKLLLMVGDGQNGKSVVTDVLTALLGPDNVTNVPLGQFGDRFAIAPTIGKLANIVSEIGDIRIVAEDVLKAIASGDRIKVEFKYRNPTHAKPTVRLIFATNTLPRFSDATEGIWRRLLILEFDVAIPPDQQDRKLSERICKEELPGIFNWAICGLRRLRKNGAFTIPKSTTRAIAQHRRESNPVRWFLEENYEPSPKARVPTKQAYEEYCRWSYNQNLDPVRDAEFGREVFRVFPKVERRRVKILEVRFYVYAGIIEKN
jgi:P4 family phage/plasmid primase-like protien